MATLVPKKKHALIKLCRHILNLPTDIQITYNHVDHIRQIFQNDLLSGMSPSDIKRNYRIEYSDFGMFLKKGLNLNLLSNKDAVNNYYKKTGQSVTNEKIIYKQMCSFKFDPYSIPQIPGYNLLLKHGIYHPINNPNGVCRDHMVSIEYGWRNKIAPNIISHFMNCQFLSNIENSKKGDKSCITIDMLTKRIEENDFILVHNTSIHLPKSNITKQKISETNKKYMNITNGIINYRVLKNAIIPEGFWRGLTKKK